jgi:hypothetical protein
MPCMCCSLPGVPPLRLQHQELHQHLPTVDVLVVAADVCSNSAMGRAFREHQHRCAAAPAAIALVLRDVTTHALATHAGAGSTTVGGFHTRTTKLQRMTATVSRQCWHRGCHAACKLQVWRVRPCGVECWHRRARRLSGHLQCHRDSRANIGR